MFCCSLLLLVGLSLRAEGRIYRCNDTRTQKCRDWAHFNLINYPPYGDSVFPTDLGLNLKDMCRMVETANPCTKPWEADCSPFDRNLLMNIIHTYRYICNPTDKDYEKYVTCFSYYNINKQVISCNTTFTKELTALYNISNVLATRRKAQIEICGIRDKYLPCIYDVTRRECGISAADWHATLMKRVLDPICPTYPIVGCFGYVDVPLPQIFVFTGIALVVIACILCIVCCCRKRNANRRNANRLERNHKEPEKPPPYCDVTFSPPTYDDSSKPPPTYEDAIHNAVHM